MKKKYIASEWKDSIENAISKTNSMTEAYKLLGLERKTFKRLAEELGLYKPNQSGKGKPKRRKNKIKLEDVFSGKEFLQTHKLKLRLIKEGYKERICECCHLRKWKGKPIPLELHHEDGDNTNNELENLKLLCPNCHALTETYRSKNIIYQKNKKKCVEGG